MLDFKIDTSQLEKYLDSVQKKLENSQSWFEDEALDIVKDHSEAIFASEGGGRWAPLSPAYRAWKELHYPGRPIGTLTGRARKEQTENPPHRSTQSSLTVWTDLDYFVRFNRGEGAQPARPKYDQQSRDELSEDLGPSYREWIMKEVL